MRLSTRLSSFDATLVAQYNSMLSIMNVKASELDLYTHRSTERNLRWKMDQVAANDLCGLAVTPDGAGCWAVDREGEVYTLGDAAFLGSLKSYGITCGTPIVGIVSAAITSGYWIYSAAGDVYAFGNLPSYGALPEVGLSADVQVVAMAAYGDASAYCLLNAAGDVFTFGDMKNVGSIPQEGIILSDPAVGIMLGDVDSPGYLIVDSRGEVYTFGELWFRGSMPAEQAYREAPVVDILPFRSTAQEGYRMVVADGSIYCFNAPFYGAPIGNMLGENIVAAAGDPVDKDGYYLLSDAGEIFCYDINSDHR